MRDMEIMAQPTLLAAFKRVYAVTHIFYDPPGGR